MVEEEDEDVNEGKRRDVRQSVEEGVVVSKLFAMFGELSKSVMSMTKTMQHL